MILCIFLFYIYVYVDHAIRYKRLPSSVTVTNPRYFDADPEVHLEVFAPDPALQKISFAKQSLFWLATAPGV